MKKIIKNALRKNKYIEIFSYMLQNNQLFNSSGSGEFGNNVDEVYAHNVAIAKMYADNYHGDLDGKTVLEIGAGFTRATLLVMIKEYGLKKAYSYDRFDCLTDIDEKIISRYGLHDYLDRLEYIAGENLLLTERIDEGGVDYIVSNAVLEHVDDLVLLFNVLNTLLAENGQMYHKVDLRCHNRFKRHGELYFHTFSDRLWKMMGGNIGQPNRKLLAYYHDLFKALRLHLEEHVVEKFAEDELLKAGVYLDTEDVSEYAVSIVEFNLFKDHN